MQKITLYGELYSKKNSKRVFSRRGKTVVLPSKVYEKSKPDFLWQLKDAQNKKIWESLMAQTKYPICLNFKIYRKTKRKFDYNNIIQGLQDILVEAGYLPDDDADHLIPFFEKYEVDSKNPRVLLSLKF